MKIMRPDYDKPRRCPNWSGPAWKWARKVKCDNGFVEYGDGIFRIWRIHTCPVCGVTILPLAFRSIAPSWIWRRIRRWWEWR